MPRLVSRLLLCLLGGLTFFALVLTSAHFFDAQGRQGGTMIPLALAAASGGETAKGVVDPNKPTKPPNDDQDNQGEDQDDPYAGFKGPAPLTGALVLGQLSGGADPFTSGGSLLTLSAMGWILWGYRAGQPRQRPQPQPGS